MNILKSILTAALALLTAAAFAAVDVNKASQAELESVKGIGPSMSAKILDARKAGPFKDWTDLQSRVKGVHEARSARFSADGLTVNGTTFVASAAPAGGRPAKAAKSGKTSKASKAAKPDSAQS
jgi:competence protein ComEA